MNSSGDYPEGAEYYYNCPWNSIEICPFCGGGHTEIINIETRDGYCKDCREFFNNNELDEAC